MRDQCENKEPCGILADVPGVVIPLGDAVAHDRARDAPDEMHEQGEKLLRIPRKRRPCDVIDRHRGDGDELYGVGAERFFSVRGMVFPPAGDVISVSPAGGDVKRMMQGGFGGVWRDV